MKDFETYKMILQKLESGGELSLDETKQFERLKEECGINDSGTVRTMGAAAKIIGVSRRTLCTWKKEPGFPMEPDGTYSPDRIAAWKKLGDFIDGDTEFSPNVCEKTFWETEFRKFRAKLTEVSYRKELGELISRAEVESLLVERALEFKKNLLGRSRRLALKIANKPAAECQKILDEDAYQILETYSRPNALTDKPIKTKPKKQARRKNGKK